MPATTNELKKIARMTVLFRRSNDEIAAEVGVAASTIGNWKRSDEYRAIIAELRDEWKAGARNRIHSMLDTALDTLEDLMLNSKVDKVRADAAKIVGEWAQLHEADIDRSQNDQGELIDILKRAVEERTQPIQIFMPPQPGGLLPSAPDIIDSTPEREPLRLKGGEKEEEEREGNAI